MDSSRTLLLILTGILAIAGLQHVLISVRNTAMRGHALLGGMVLASAAVSLAHAMVPPVSPGPPVIMLLSVAVATVLAAAWQLAGTVARGKVASLRQQQELAHASRLSIVGELTASIAHEINQPLGAILSNADAGEILLEGPDPPLDEIRRILADIQRDGLRASDVIRHVRALVRKRDMASDRVDANALASDVVALLEPEARRRRLSMTVDLFATSPHFGGDRALMEQVLINLLLNAMDSTDAEDDSEAHRFHRHSVQVRVGLTGDGGVQFTVVDSGHGIPAGQLKHLFTSFYTSKPHGMGLGLSIARSIVEAHGGRIRAENRHCGGARFCVALPPCRDTAAPVVRPPGRLPHADRGAARNVHAGSVPGAVTPGRATALRQPPAKTGATCP